MANPSNSGYTEKDEDALEWEHSQKVLKEMGQTFELISGVRISDVVLEQSFLEATSCCTPPDDQTENTTRESKTLDVTMIAGLTDNFE